MYLWVLESNALHSDGQQTQHALHSVIHLEMCHHIVSSLQQALYKWPLNWHSRIPEYLLFNILLRVNLTGVGICILYRLINMQNVFFFFEGWCSSSILHYTQNESVLFLWQSKQKFASNTVPCSPMRLTIWEAVKTCDCS